jgi:hypothetical protein
MGTLALAPAADVRCCAAAKSPFEPLPDLSVKSIRNGQCRRTEFPTTGRDRFGTLNHVRYEFVRLAWQCCQRRHCANEDSHPGDALHTRR